MRSLTSRIWMAVAAIGLVGVTGYPVQAAFVFASFNNPDGGQPSSFGNNAHGTATVGALDAPVAFDFAAPTGPGTARRNALPNLAPVSLPSAGEPASGALILDQPINLLDFTSEADGAGTDFAARIVVIPEPSSLSLGSISSLVGLACRLRRRGRAAA